MTHNGTAKALILALAWSTFVLGCAVLWASLGEETAGAASRDACQPAQPRDYSAPLKALPSVHRIPSTGVLPFAPPTLRLGRLDNEVAADGGPASFRISSSATSHKYKLGWKVSLDAARVNRRGAVIDRLPTTRFRLNRPRAFGLESQFLTTALPPTPGFYRLDLTIQNTNGEALGRYSEYARVVPLSIDVKLSIAEGSVVAGEAVWARVENHGTAPVFFERGLNLERRVGSGWEWIQVNSGFSAPMAIEIMLDGGAVGRCEGIVLPADLRPGRYRISKPVSAGSRDLDLYAPIKVPGG